MYQQNASAIIAAVPQAAGEDGILGLFGPTVDDKIVFADYYKLTPANIPLLIGNNNYEGGLFRTTFALVGIFFPDVWWTDLNLWAFTCPTGIRANASLAAGVKTWRYRYFGIFPDLYISSEAGTWHAAEVPILFDTAPAIPGATADEISIANYMRAAWSTFAKDPVNGLTNYGWPTYNNSEDTLIRLAYDNITGPNLINPYAYDADCIFVNVTDVNTTWDPTLPDLGATVTPTGMADLTLETAPGKKSIPTAN
jgi:cholinesterase